MSQLKKMLTDRRSYIYACKKAMRTYLWTRSIAFVTVLVDILLVLFRYAWKQIDLILFLIIILFKTFRLHQTLTKTDVIFKDNVDAVNAAQTTQIHLPPHGLFCRSSSYRSCPHTRWCISIHGIACAKQRLITRVSSWLGGSFMVK